MKHLAARRTEQAAIDTGAIAPTQCGVITERSALDALSILLYYILEELDQSPETLERTNKIRRTKFSSLLTHNISGTFNNTNP